MLKFLEVCQFALIEHQEIELQKGLNLLTGETGSGKSIIVDALGLLLGEKGYVEMIRSGADKAVVSGLFELPDDARLRREFDDSGLDFHPEELIVRRELSASGKSRAFVNNQLAPVSFLRGIGRFLADIHGQTGEQALYAPEMQLRLLDIYTGALSLLAEVEKLCGDYQETSRRLAALRLNEQQRLRTMDLLTFQTGEIEKAQLKSEDEDEKLADEHVLLANADKLFQLSQAAYSELYEAETSASAALKHASRFLEELSRVDSRCHDLHQQLQSAKIAIDDVSLSLREYLSNIKVNPQRLEWVENRMADLERLKRKYGQSVREVLAFYSKCKTDLQVLQKADENIVALEKERADLRQQYWHKAQELSRQRKTAALSLEKSVEKELAQLAMQKTRFSIAFAEASPGGPAKEGLGGTSAGIDEIEFLISPNPGEDLKPLVKVASGGEISRIMLALKTVKSIDERGKTLVFDEVDSGIGGQTADVLGQKLKRLSRHNQVLCVTHLPQIASYADNHFYIEKRVDKGRTFTHVVPLDKQARIQEIARMISGERVTPSVLKHAAELVKSGGA